MANATTIGASSTVSQLSNELADAVEMAGNSTVTVNGRRRMPASGIVWSDDGLVVTASHVVERDDDLTIGLGDGRTVPATLKGRDNGTDIALLHVAETGLHRARKSGDSPRAGNLVVAVGRPGSEGPMASLGVVSVVGGPWRTGGGQSIEGFIRSDVAMLPGFSGGPLADVTGAILGMNSSTLGRGGGMTLPAAAIDAVVASLRDHGKVRRGYLGVGAQAVPINARMTEALGLTQERALVIVSLEAGGPAERDGLMLGDVIVAIDGTAVESVEQLQELLGGEAVGRTAAVTIARGGVVQTPNVTIGERS